jgi:membrane protease YdiL (CAAX protease family)
LHLQHYYLDSTYFFLYPLFIISYILMGCIAGYLRVRYTNGLYVCILLHMTINTIACITRSL